MRWKTYHKLESRYAGLQNRWKVGVIARFGLRLWEGER